MSKPTKDQIKRLSDLEGDSESYHSTFDDILEEKLMELDPQWMKAMEKIYNDSGCSRWCA